MTLTIQLLGRPRLHGRPDPYEFRSRKSWCMLAYLLLTEQPPSRRDLAGLFFSEAEDPLRALRWSLAEIRRGLDGHGTVEGDPVTLTLGSGVTVDAHVVVSGHSSEAVVLPGLDGPLLDGMTPRDAAVFESWLLMQQRRYAAAAEAVLHEAALVALAREEFDAALGFAARAAAMSPLDENHQALLIRLYRLAGDEEAARRQYRLAVDLLDDEIGPAPHPAIEAVWEEVLRPDDETGPTDVEAILEAGAAAVAAGSPDPGIAALRLAVRLADGAGLTTLRVRARLDLAEALVHSVRGLDEDGLAMLYAVDEIAFEAGDTDAVARARAEIGYVDFLRARYDRAERWLGEALELGGDDPSLRAKVLVYRGSVASDRGDYPGAEDLLKESVAIASHLGEVRREAFALSMLGRIGLLRGDLDSAVEGLDAAIRLSERDHWLAFLPWPQALRGETSLRRGDRADADAISQQALARARRLGDPCWEGMAGRGVGLVAEADGRHDEAFATLVRARSRCRSLADTYLWVDAYILEAQCELGVRHDHPQATEWTAALREMTERTGMAELAARSRDHQLAGR